MEYRGYDSAGIYTPSLGVLKTVETVSGLGKIKCNDTIGIGHTRWATHGEPTEHNAHTHADTSKKVFVVHNGIIENYKTIKANFGDHKFLSDTDTEVIPHVIAEYLACSDSLADAVMKALPALEGAFGIVVTSTAFPDEIVVARQGSPIVLGVHSDGMYVASDPCAIVKYTKDIVYLEDGDIATLSRSGYFIKTFDQKNVTRKQQRIEWGLDIIKKGGYKHFMMKEMMEGKSVIEYSIRGRIDLFNSTTKLGGLS